MKSESILADWRSGRIADSYLWVASDGTDCKKSAMEFSKRIQCQSGTLGFKEGPCGDCDACHKMESGSHPDLFLLDFDSQGKILDLEEDEMRRQKEYRIDAIRLLRGRAYLTPVEGNKKIFIIDGAERLSLESANALLKVLEESPPHALWILLTTNPGQVLPTIRSRCRQVSLSSKVSEFHLREEFENEPWRDPLPFVSRLLSEMKSGQQRQGADRFLKELAEWTSHKLHQNPSEKNLERLESILEAEIDLKRNVSPQLILETVLLSF